MTNAAKSLSPEQFEDLKNLLCPYCARGESSFRIEYGERNFAHGEPGRMIMCQANVLRLARGEELPATESEPT